ncbi:bifunctional acetate--CoA ligase family protein/GNAT family N-acetyltransferase [Phormidium sp. LEGE 05292]|uniref:bifunctional acetate--CoA ligase family protein/GNAT family N-acetyltransferase n=1 Tax=[Phormidium] sp. LEGE 05292 TaxID=767427 RepID=UPI00187E353D|nr:bifunctional acetate--CoA ligase family protein/GNAT family N-acetyltransferase [Phormidium sp. LEGE 05292]MBE9227128.1 bifunctional acetate--CoA ligase family protein/GNAT family N-acetyltransferase [Phormidium sp. LEGE 05292]
MQTYIKPTTDPAHDVLRYEHQPLDAIFAPKNVAVIGATEKLGSVGRTILWNLISSPFGGTVFPVNPKRPSVLGIKAYPSIGEVPGKVDLAVIVTPAATVPGVISECVDAGVKGAIVISAGFKEIGAAGLELERQVLEQARRGRMRIIGPNCLGVMNPVSGLNATFASKMALPGNVGFISQSGALCTGILDWSFQENVGFSAFVSIGSMLDVGWGDLIYYLGDDPHTQSIVIYMESIGDARSFLSAAREVALSKPIIVIKVGQTEAAAKAAASHTGSLTGSDEVLNAAFRRSGVLRVNTIDDLFNMAEVLAKQPRPKGKRLTILTNAGGPGVLATDALITGGGELAELSSETVEKLQPILPPSASTHNPIDILGDADPERYSKSLEIALKDPNSDGMLIVLTPQAMSNPTKTAEDVVEQLKTNPVKGKPILASWMGGHEVAAGEAILNRASIYTFPYPDTAAHVFNLMWRYSYNLRGIYETPILSDNCGEKECDIILAKSIINSVKQTGRTILTEYESKQLLASYNIPTVPTEIATTEEEAVELAEKIGYPVVLKLYSETITHKTDVGGVRLLLKDAETVRGAYRGIQSAVAEKVGAEHFFGVTVQPMLNLEGYEIIIGSSVDPQFGPVLLFGTGGQLVEVFKDRALALPPLNSTLARRMMEQTKIYTALKGVRGRPPVDLAKLEQLLVQFSLLVVEQPWIKEIDINPLLASPDRLIALDARVVLHDPEISEDKLPKPAIRPYPTQYVAPWTMKDGTEVTIRPIRPEDEPLAFDFHKMVSEESVYLRYAHLVKLSQRTTHERLSRICFIDYDRQMALVAEYTNPETGQPQIIGISRLSKLHGTDEAEFSMLIADKYQHKGLGTEFLRRLLQIARDEKLNRVTADILTDNMAMQRISQKLGFRAERILGEPMVKMILDL